MRGLLVHPAFGLQCVVDRLGAAFDLQAAGQDAVGVQSPVDTIVHHLPQPRGAAFQVIGPAARFLVGAFHARDGFARGLGHFQHFLGGFERKGDWRALIRVLARGQFLFGHHEAAADGIEHLPQCDVALRVGGHQDHAVGVSFQLGVIVECQITLGIEFQRRQALGVQQVRAVQIGQHRLGLVVVIGVGDKPREAQNGGAVGGVANTGEGQRAMQRRAHPRKLKGRGTHHVQKSRGSDHRPHGVRGRRANAHFEHLEDG